MESPPQTSLVNDEPLTSHCPVKRKQNVHLQEEDSSMSINGISRRTQRQGGKTYSIFQKVRLSEVSVSPTKSTAISAPKNGQMIAEKS